MTKHVDADCRAPKRRLENDYGSVAAQAQPVLAHLPQISQSVATSLMLQPLTLAPMEPLAGASASAPYGTPRNGLEFVWVSHSRTW